MSDRYWVGGTATWDATTTSVWSTTSGGSGGASVPTSSDNVFFDQSGTYTVTVGAASTPCANLTVSATTYTFQSNSIQAFGSITLASGTVWNLNYFFGGAGSYTLTTNGVSGGAIICVSGATVTLGSALTLTNVVALNVSSGFTLNTVGYSLSCPAINITIQSPNLNFSNSAITFTSSGTYGFGNAKVTSTSGATITFTSTGSITIRLGTNNYIPALRFTGASGNTVNIYGAGSTVQNISCTYIGAKSFGFISQTIFVAFNLRGTPGNLYSISGAITKAGTWYMGANSVDGGNNTGVVFSNGSGIDYLNVSYITGSSFPVQGNFLELF